MKTDIRFIRNANEIYARYVDWKKLDKFYFIPLNLDMTYVLDGIPVRMAEKPLYLGTFIRNTLEHKDIFTALCPHCSHQLLPHGYNGSPLSGRVNLDATCPECDWNGSVTVKGWRIRSEALKATQKADKVRRLKAKVLRPCFEAATIEEFLKIINNATLKSI